MSQLHASRELNTDADNLAEEWRRREKSFQNYFTAAELKAKSRDTQVAILLNCAGEKVRDIFDAFGIKSNKPPPMMNFFKRLYTIARRPGHAAKKMFLCRCGRTGTFAILYT